MSADNVNVIDTQRTLARNPIQPYALPGEECLAYNKIQWNLSADRVVLLVHDMQNYWVDLLLSQQNMTGLSRLGCVLNMLRFEEVLHDLGLPLSLVKMRAHRTF